MSTKSKTLFLVLDSLFLIVFNVCFFLLTDQEDRTTTTWINYGCIHAAYILFLLTPLLYPKNVAKDVAMPVYSLTFGFWWFELVLSVILMIVSIQTKYNVIIQVICWAVVLIRLIILSLVNINTSEKQQRHQQELFYVKTAEGLLRTKLDGITDKQEYRQLEQVYDYVRTSPVKSNASAQVLESQILQKINSLVLESDASTISTLCKDILYLAQQRNQNLLTNNSSL